MTGSQPQLPQPTQPSGFIARALSNLMASHDLPEHPAVDPMPTLLAWFAEAARSGRYDDPNAMTLATASPDGAPSARVLLCKAIEPNPPALVFYSNYISRKGRELSANPRAAAVFHWPHAKRQARIEGDVCMVSASESDAYFKSRSLLSQIGATVSRQSAPIQSRSELVSAAMAVALDASLHGTLPRPQHWGGFRLSIRIIELWSAGEGRLHDRVQWSRIETADATGESAWRAQRLSP